jgi:hypothetical protein
MAKSDYTKDNTNFYDLLPEIYKNDFTKSLFNNLFNRYVTKDELNHVNGYIGKGNPNALINRNIQESTPDRQAYQLQPMLYSKIGTIEHMMTWKDILNELDKVGIDTNTLKEWLTPQKFNWVPPLDIDKILHFRDYYWYNPDNPSDIPQYLTIKNLCNVSDAKVKLYENIINTNGDVFPIVNINSNNNTFKIQTDMTSVFDTNSIFYTRNAPGNISIDNSFWSVLSSEYDNGSNTTTIFVSSNISDITLDGEISLNEFLDILKIERDCICSGAIGFDQSLFDDNQLGGILWNTSMMNDITHSSLNAWVIANTNLNIYDLWHDDSTNTLKQFSESLSELNGTDFQDENNWVIIQRNMTILLARTEGQHFFDFSIGCEYPRNQWVDQNFWVHRSVIPNFSIAKQAEIPIIEFSPYLELNEWTCNIPQWLYRENKFKKFELVEDVPSLFELNDIDIYKVFPDRLELNSKFGDLSDTFKPDYKFTILNSFGSIYQISNIAPGFGGSFKVLGDATNDYTTITDIVNVNKLPAIFKIRNSSGVLLDHDWTIDSISFDGVKTTLTIISTEVINSFSFAGA